MLDTHAWLDLADNRGNRFHPTLRRRVELSASRGHVYIAAITVWEVAMLARRGELRLSLSTFEFVGTALRRTQTAIAPLEPAIAVDSVELPDWDHKDPADRLIVATARYRGAILVTRDGDILDYAADIGAVRAWQPSDPHPVKPREKRDPRDEQKKRRRAKR
ncbi:MAG: type II toxin-antitoxin system VapC family toxin [Polyangiaceae bacterium]|nr:type II toxin-antitoxin system VapC family toxin [Polyangiaceae bacterium]